MSLGEGYEAVVITLLDVAVEFLSGQYVTRGLGLREAGAPDHRASVV